MVMFNFYLYLATSISLFNTPNDYSFKSLKLKGHKFNAEISLIMVEYY